MEALNWDLHTTRAVLGNRFHTTEESKGTLQTSHQALAQEQLAEQSSLREDLGLSYVSRMKSRRPQMSTELDHSA